MKKRIRVSFTCPEETALMLGVIAHNLDISRSELLTRMTTLLFSSKKGAMLNEQKIAQLAKK